MTSATLARTIEPARSSQRRAQRRRRGGIRWLILTLALILVAASMLVVGLAVRRAISDEPTPLGGPSETSAGPGVQVVISEPLDRPVIAVPEPSAAPALIPAPRPAPAPATRVRTNPPAAQITNAPARTPREVAPKVAGAVNRPTRQPETLSSPADLAEDAAAAGLTGRASPPTTEERP